MPPNLKYERDGVTLVAGFDGDGVVTEDEFISGCMKDDVFIMLLQKFSGEEVWGIQ